MCTIDTSPKQSREIIARCDEKKKEGVNNTLCIAHRFWTIDSQNRSGVVWWGWVSKQQRHHQAIYGKSAQKEAIVSVWTSAAAEQ